MGDDIYLHFLDRELRESVNSNLQENEICKIIMCSLFMPGNIYIAYSHYFETLYNMDKAKKIIGILDKNNYIKFHSGHKNYSDFIESRRIMYAHDMDRYPMYFSDCISDPKLNNIETIIRKSTTKTLTGDMFVESEILNGLSTDTKSKYKYFMVALKDEAITKAVFNKFYSKISKKDAEIVKDRIIRKISELYTERYLSLCNGTIITGISGLEYFDVLAKDQLSTNYNLYKAIFRKIKLELKWNIIKKIVSDPGFKNIKQKLYLLINKLVELNASNNNDYSSNKLISTINNMDIMFEQVSDYDSLQRNLSNFQIYIESINKNEVVRLELMQKPKTIKNKIGDNRLIKWILGIIGGILSALIAAIIFYFIYGKS